MTSKDLTIIITTYRSEEKVEDCLNSIDSKIKVILIENSSNKEFKNSRQLRLHFILMVCPRSIESNPCRSW